MREWIIKRHREHRNQDTELRQSKQKTTQTVKNQQHVRTPLKTEGETRCLRKVRGPVSHEIQLWEWKKNKKTKNKKTNKNKTTPRIIKRRTQIQICSNECLSMKRIKHESDINKHVMYHSPGKNNFWLGPYSSPLYFFLLAFVSCL